jgi:hypothetical protein
MPKPSRNLSLRTLFRENTTCTNTQVRDTLGEVLPKSWAKTSEEAFVRLLSTMPRRIQVVREADGCTKYWIKCNPFQFREKVAED